MHVHACMIQKSQGEMKVHLQIEFGVEYNSSEIIGPESIHKELITCFRLIQVYLEFQLQLQLQSTCLLLCCDTKPDSTPHNTS